MNSWTKLGAALVATALAAGACSSTVTTPPASAGAAPSAAAAGGGGASTVPAPSVAAAASAVPAASAAASAAMSVFGPTAPPAGATLTPFPVGALAAGSGQGVKIQLIQPGVHPYPAGEDKGAQAEATRIGATLEIATGNWAPETDNANVQNAMTKGVQAIIIQPNSSAAIVPSIQQADAAGICTIALLTNPGGSADTVFSGMKAYIGWNELTDGQAGGEALAKAMGGKGNVVIIEGALVSSASVDREKGAMQVWATKYPGIHVLAKQPGNYDAVQARNIMTDFVQRFGTQINGVLSITANMATAAADVIAANSSLAGKVPIVSFWGSSQFQSYIKAGKTYATTAFAPYDEGVAAIDLAVECAHGDKSPIFLDERELPGLVPLAPDGYVSDAQNLSVFKAQW